MLAISGLDDTNINAKRGHPTKMMRNAICALILLSFALGCAKVPGDPDEFAPGPGSEWAVNWAIKNGSPFATPVFDSQVFTRLRTITASSPLYAPGVGFSLTDGQDFLVLGDDPNLAFLVYAFAEKKLFIITRLQRLESRIQATSLGCFTDDHTWTRLQHVIFSKDKPEGE